MCYSSVVIVCVCVSEFLKWIPASAYPVCMCGAPAEGVTIPVCVYLCCYSCICFIHCIITVVFRLRVSHMVDFHYFFFCIFQDNCVKLSVIISGIQLYISFPISHLLCQVTRTTQKHARRRDLVRFGTHSAHFANVTLFVKFLFGLVFQLTNILHGEPVPAIHPAKYLSVENREQSSL